MQQGQDSYSKVQRFVVEGTGQAGTELTNKWFSPSTINSQQSPKAVLVVNGGNTASCNLHSYGELLSTTTNLLILSENIRNGLTAGGNRWVTYSSNHPSSPPFGWSRIVMPDGSTNGVLLRPNSPSVNAGIYQSFPSTSILSYGKVYTVSVWAAGDSGGGVYTTNQAFRISYFNGSDSVCSPDFPLTETPTRYSFTFVANNPNSQTDENIAFGNPSGSGATTQMVLWGAQLVEGNTVGAYLPTSTQYNGLTTANSVGSTTTTTGAAGNGFKSINSTRLTIPASSSTLVNIEAFSVSTGNANNVAPPANFAMYGLY